MRKEIARDKRPSGDNRNDPVTGGKTIRTAILSQYPFREKQFCYAATPAEGARKVLTGQADAGLSTK
jgi:hypothetical protein